MASTRLPGKPLADIGGNPMIVHVWRRGMEAEVGRVVVAAAEPEIADAVVKAGGEAVLTDPGLPSGSDRIYQALQKVDPDHQHDLIVNLQGDLPALDPGLLTHVLAPFQNPAVDMTTLVAEITEEAEATNPNVVKAIVSFGEAQPGGNKSGRALYFTRATAPTGPGPLYHHIGIYGFRRAALAKFVELPPSPLEIRERLEQLRALEAGFRIEATCVTTVPFGVDTQEDLERARALLK